MVATHLKDLDFVEATGFATMYVERPNEESHPDFAKGTLVDLRVGKKEDIYLATTSKVRQSGI
jgi:2-haloacid dehalogenase